MQPSRLSSEAPEVVPGQPQVENLVYINYEEGRYKRASSEDSHWLKPYDERERESKKLVPTPQIVYDQISYQGKPVRRRRTFGLVTTIIFVVVAFFIGGGIGGGVGGALAAKEKSRYVLPLGRRQTGLELTLLFIGPIRMPPLLLLQLPPQSSSTQRDVLSSTTPHTMPPVQGQAS
jgi:hypothetical protein